MGEQDKGEAMTRPAPVIAAELRATASGLVPYAESRLMQEAADRLDALTDALAQARREVCNLRPSVCLGAQTAVSYAKSRGWDCFKEDNK
jgi:transposase InsO family protein